VAIGHVSAAALAFAVAGENERVRTALAAVAVAVLAGCGVPHELAKQAEEVQSVSAEGALLAHDASEGSTTKTFTREHAKALRKLLRPVREAIEDERLAGVADDVDRTLGELEAAPGDEALAAGAERKLEQLAGSAEELAG
jgi:predicted outer membrane protein